MALGFDCCHLLLPSLFSLFSWWEMAEERRCFLSSVSPWKLGHGDLAGTITTDLSGVPPLWHSCSLKSLLQLQVLHSSPTHLQKSMKIALSPNRSLTSPSTASTVGPNSCLARQLQTPTSLNYHELCRGMVWNLRWWWLPNDACLDCSRSTYPWGDSRGLSPPPQATLLFCLTGDPVDKWQTPNLHSLVTMRSPRPET